MVCRNSQGRWEQFGVTSYGWNYCNHDIAPGVDASVVYYRDWIEKNTGI